MSEVIPIPCDLSRDAFDVTYPTPTCGQTDACENITFQQFRLPAVNISQWKLIRLKPKSLILNGEINTDLQREGKTLFFNQLAPKISWSNWIAISVN